MHDVETSTTPPDTDTDDGDEDVPAARLAMHWIAVDDRVSDAAVQLFGEPAQDPDAFADAVLRVALGLGQVIGPDYAWAVTRRLAAYDGTAGGATSTGPRP